MTTIEPETSPYPASVTVDFGVDRWLGGRDAGHYGTLILTTEDGHWGSLNPERLLGRKLGPGSQVRVTVEVLEERPITDTRPNPWHEPQGRVPRCDECRAANPDHPAYQERTP